MYDFWYTMGVAVIQPALLDAITPAKPAFDFGQRLVIDFVDDVPVLRPNAPSTGLLENKPTTDVRLAIATFVKGYSASAPPIGIYTAGRFCQLVLIPYFASAQQDDSSFEDIIDLAHQAYVKAVGAGKESQLATFPAFLGLCLMDGRLVQDFAAPTPKLIEILAEFGMKPDATTLEWQIATAFVKAPEFGDATQLLMLADNDPWQGGGSTLEQAYFWDGKSEYAIP
jgi:hypothetical protein